VLRGLMTSEGWFEKAITADPIALGAYSRKLHFLASKWRGNAKMQAEFALHCYENAPEALYRSSPPHACFM